MLSTSFRDFDGVHLHSVVEVAAKDDPLAVGSELPVRLVTTIGMMLHVHEPLGHEALAVATKEIQPEPILRARDLRRISAVAHEEGLVRRRVEVNAPGVSLDSICARGVR